MANEYSQNSITSLKGEDQVRKRPSVIFGTNDSQGAAHGIFEIIANSIDEGREGLESAEKGGRLYGDKIKVSIWKDSTVEVTDNGRGVPMDWNESEGKYNWELVFCTLYASGKYDSANYGAALGLNGLGATAMQYASSFMDVWSTRDGKTYHMHFEKGVPIGKLEITKPIRPDTGTTIKFRPDSEVFIEMAPMSPVYYVDLLRRQAMLTPGLTITLWHEEDGNEVTITYKDGIKGFVQSLSSKAFVKSVMYNEDVKYGTDREGEEPYKLKMRCAMSFTREMPDIDLPVLEIYHNSSLMYEGGVTLDALKSGVLTAVYMYGEMHGKLKKADKILFRDIESMLICIGDTSAPGHRTYFKNQTKGAINNPFIKKAFTEFISYSLYHWMESNTADADLVIEEVLKNKEAREEADKVSKKVIQRMTKPMTFGNKPEKFVDCTSKNPFERELYIVEGDSALGSCKLSRDSKFQAIMPVRGKIMNCLKQDLSDILKSEIIVDLMRVLGCGIEAKSKYIKDLDEFEFDINKLNYNKIIICTDADVDGMHIRCLLITMIFRLAPSLLKHHKVFVAETPLFEITWGKDEFKFAYTDEERDKILKELEDSGVNLKKVKVARSKGLGENDPKMMNISTMDPLTRKLVPITCDDPTNKDVIWHFNSIMGDDLEARRAFIERYFEYLEEKKQEEIAEERERENNVSLG